MEQYKLASEYREQSGKGAARKMRTGGMIPAILYGRDEDSIAIAVDELQLRRILAANWETAIVDLSVAGKVKKECNAIIKQVQQQPGTGRILHVDFQHVHTGVKLRIDVPVTLTGTPRGVKDMGGILEHGLRQVAIRCLPKDIPDHIDIDVAELVIHDSIHVKDIAERYPDLEFLDELESTLANVVPPKIEVEPTVEEAEEAEEGEPEVIAKGKEDKEEGSSEEEK
jgi:large subunit ribosomal protein L25